MPRVSPGKRVHEARAIRDWLARRMPVGDKLAARALQHAVAIGHKIPVAHSTREALCTGKLELAL